MKNSSGNTSTKRKAPAKVSDELTSKLGKLFEDELKDIYWAEKALVKAIPKMIKNATNEELIAALENHLEETQEHVTRVEEVFQLIGKEPKQKNVKQWQAC